MLFFKDVHAVGSTGAPDTNGVAPGVNVPETGRVACVGMPEDMLSMGGTPVPVAAAGTSDTGGVAAAVVVVECVVPEWDVEEDNVCRL